MQRTTLRLALVVALLLGCAIVHAEPKRNSVAGPRPARAMRVSATAYCASGTTKSGVPTQSGIIAADPRILPLGTVVKILDPAFRGTYQVMDTGPQIKGRDIDIFMTSCGHAKRFGRKAMRVQIVTLAAPPK
jgi:3D (Asp-Asp-Asp) domain-containing protein